MDPRKEWNQPGNADRRSAFDDSSTIIRQHRSRSSSLVVMYAPSSGAHGDCRKWRPRLETPACVKRLKPVVGKGFAVLQSGKFHTSGSLAWLAWAGVHLQFLAQSSLRVSVFLQWVWTYLTGQRGSRLIVNHYGAQQVKPAVEEPLDLTSSSRV